MHSQKILRLLSLLFLFAQCHTKKTFDTSQLHGLWQSLNNKNQVLAFKSDGSFINYVNEKDFFGELNEWNAIHYKVHQIIDAERVELILFDYITKKEFMRAEVHCIDDNRIRVLFLKHHHILDIADEYYKTDGFGNFEQIMESFY